MFRDKTPDILSVSVSVPNLIFGDNIKEIQKSDLPIFIEKLIDTLLKMDIEITSEAIESAKPLMIDFEKNLVLPVGIKSLPAMQKMAASKLSRLENTQIGFKRGGNQLLMRCNSWGFTAYDKNKEMREKLSNLTLKGVLPSQDILRLGIRFSKYETLIRWLKNAGIPIEQPRVKDLFDEAVSKQMLNYIWNLIKENIPKVYEVKDAADMLHRIDTDSKDKLAYAFIEMLKAENGAEEMKILLESYTSTKNAGNFFKEYKRRCKVVGTKLKSPDIVDEITEQSEKFDLLTPDKFVDADKDKDK